MEGEVFGGEEHNGERMAVRGFRRGYVKFDDSESYEDPCQDRSLQLELREARNLNLEWPNVT